MLSKVKVYNMKLDEVQFAEHEDGQTGLLDLQMMTLWYQEVEKTRGELEELNLPEQLSFQINKIFIDGKKETLVNAVIDLDELAIAVAKREFAEGSFDAPDLQFAVTADNMQKLEDYFDRLGSQDMQVYISRANKKLQEACKKYYEEVKEKK